MLINNFLNLLNRIFNNQYVGLISESEILDWNETSNLIQRHICNLASPSVNMEQHLFDVLKVMDENGLSLVPVIDHNQEYIGSISNKKLLYTIAQSVSVQSVGSVIVLEIHEKDYNMSEICRIIESNNAKILSSYITSVPDSTKLELTIKVNRVDIRDIINDSPEYFIRLEIFSGSFIILNNSKFINIKFAKIINRNFLFIF